MDHSIKLSLITKDFNTIKKIFYPLNHEQPGLKNQAKEFLKKSSLIFTENYVKKSVREEKENSFLIWHGYRVGRFLYLCLSEQSLDHKFACEFLVKFSEILNQFSDDLNSMEMLLLITELFTFYESKQKKSFCNIKTEKIIFKESIYFDKGKIAVKNKIITRFVKINLFIIFICICIIFFVVFVPMFGI